MKTMKYANYSFNLNWDELPEELQEQKIDEVIEHGFRNGEYARLDGTEDAAESDEDAKENLHLRDEAEQFIKAHFPIYF